VRKEVMGISVLFFAVFGAIATFFLIFPSFDLMVTSFFYDGEFFLKNNPFVYFIYRVAPLFGIVFGVGAFFLWLYLIIKKQQTITFSWKHTTWGRKELAFVALALALGPGLFVNGVFKEGFGRARPAQIVEFGGEKSFTPPFVIAKECKSNCSFVCGHASAGFFFVCVALVARKEWQKKFFGVELDLERCLALSVLFKGGTF
jgi:lipid A 4'-phosphatase